MIAYENDSDGCMIWTPDSEVWVKDFIVGDDLDAAHQGKGYRAYVSHFPANTGQKGTGFASPYPGVTTSYTGEVYHATLAGFDRAALRVVFDLRAARKKKDKEARRSVAPPWLRARKAWRRVGRDWSAIPVAVKQVRALLSRPVNAR